MLHIRTHTQTRHTQGQTDRQTTETHHTHRYKNTHRCRHTDTHKDIQSNTDDKYDEIQ